MRYGYCITIAPWLSVTHRMHAKSSISQKLSHTQKKNSGTKKSFSEQCASFLKIWLLLKEKKIVRINREEIFLNLIPMLTIEARVLNPSTCEVQGRRPGGGCGKRSPQPIFFNRMVGTIAILLVTSQAHSAW